MDRRTLGMRIVALFACPVLLLPPAHCFIHVRAPTLGSLCAFSSGVALLRVEKVSPGKEILVYRKARDLKGQLPCEVIKHRLSSEESRKHDLDKGVVVVLFYLKHKQVVCTGTHWYAGEGKPTDEGVWPVTVRREPEFLRCFCGDADKLATAVRGILAGQEVVVPCMKGERDKELRAGTGPLHRMRASLKLRDYDPNRDVVAEDGKD